MRSPHFGEADKSVLGDGGRAQRGHVHMVGPASRRIVSYVLIPRLEKTTGDRVASLASIVAKPVIET